MLLLLLLLQFFELIVEYLCQWPTSILLSMFIEQPTFQSVEKISAFSYGNGIPLRVLTRFLNLSNPLWTHLNSLQLHKFYHMWRIEKGAVHRATYYNVGLKQMCWLNGPNHQKTNP